MLIAFFEDYLDCVSDLISHEMIWSMDKLQHHAGVSCLDHSFNVSYLSYVICKKFNLDYRSAARGGLLHDFFLYDWHDSKKGAMHGIKHPKIALENANKFFHLNKTEK